MLSADSDTWHCLLCKIKFHHNNLYADTDTWHCLLLCKIKFHHNFLFTLFDDIEIHNLNNSNSTKFCDSLPKFEVVTKVSTFSNYSDNEPEYNLLVLSNIIQLMKYKT